MSSSSKGLDNAVQGLSHGSVPMEGSAMGHATAVGLDALAVAPVQPAGPARATLWAPTAPSRDGLQGGGRNG